ncbi:sulfatase-like hydrolase/transferase [Yoonia sp. 2307UL14-13]|uniref:sulfatase-like hydrolase/transferase n=1 Tax=Yoonia sp. 2307UL14-13 TaxID=3126506 RepID=UPI0030B5D3BD
MLSYRKHLAVAAFTALLFVSATFLLMPGLSGKDIGRIGAWILIIGLIAGWPYLKKRPPKAVWIAVLCGLIAIPAFVIERAFGKIDVLGLLVHLQLGIDGADLSGMGTDIREGIGGVVLFLGSCFALWALMNLPRWSFGVPAVALLMINPIAISMLVYATSAPVESDLHTRLATPQVTSSDIRPDVILIYLEGTERTFNQTSKFGDSYRVISDYEKEALTFTNIHQVSGTGWTLGGLTASMCGLPVLPNGLRQLNKFEGQNDFMSSKICLSDVTARVGYQNKFLLGSDVAFSGKNHLLMSHNFTEIFDRANLEGMYDQQELDRAMSGWVYDDQMLFDAAGRVYDESIEDPDPLLMIVETFGPHGKTAALSRRCTPDGQSVVTADIEGPVTCMLDEMQTFITHVQSNRNNRPTLVFLLSDHLHHGPAMKDIVSDAERRNTALMLSFGYDTPYLTPGAANDRLASMLDLYPTMLAVMGLAGPDARGGLGVSLFSDDPTLVAEKGLEQLNDELYRNPDLALAIWN